MRISDWSSDVCSSDLDLDALPLREPAALPDEQIGHVLEESSAALSRLPPRKVQEEPQVTRPARLHALLQPRSKARCRLARDPSSHLVSNARATSPGDGSLRQGPLSIC